MCLQPKFPESYDYFGLCCHLRLLFFSLSQLQEKKLRNMTDICIGQTPLPNFVSGTSEKCKLSYVSRHGVSIKVHCPRSVVLNLFGNLGKHDYMVAKFTMGKGKAKWFFFSIWNRFFLSTFDFKPIVSLFKLPKDIFVF